MLKIFNPVECKACATSAMRDAKNGKEIVDYIKEKTGITIEIISGKKEASIIYDTHIEQKLGKDADCMYMDVGGGSTQITLIHSGKLIYSHSFNIGTVRMMNNLVKSEEKEAFLSELKELCFRHPNFKLVGSGGNINKLNKLLQENKSKETVCVDKLTQLNKELSSLAVETRMKKYKIKRDRAEVISFAADIFIAAANAMQVEEIQVPSISISDGIINKMFLRYVAEKEDLN